MSTVVKVQILWISLYMSRKRHILWPMTQRKQSKVLGWRHWTKAYLGWSYLSKSLLWATLIELGLGASFGASRALPDCFEAPSSLRRRLGTISPLSDDEPPSPLTSRSPLLNPLFFTVLLLSFIFVGVGVDFITVCSPCAFLAWPLLKNPFFRPSGLAAADSMSWSSTCMEVVPRSSSSSSASSRTDPSLWQIFTILED